jgi:hypothetical protein
MFVDLKQQYRASLKSSDTEERIDLMFYRPIGFAWAYAAKKLGITPNMITIASIFLGVGAGVAFYSNVMWVNIVGMLLLMWANSFDSADGQLARMTKQYSRLGRILDGVSGDLWFATIYIAICLRQNATSQVFIEHTWIIWLLAVLAGMSHAKQAAMADCYRQFHLYFLKGEAGSELENSDDLKAKYEELTWGKNFFQKLVLFFYCKYTVSQESLTPRMQEFRRKLREKYPDGQLPQELRDEFRALSLPLMKFTNILSFNWRTITLFVTLFAGQPWLYFVCELTIFNALLVYMMRRHEGICRRMTAKI